MSVMGPHQSQLLLNMLGKEAIVFVFLIPSTWHLIAFIQLYCYDDVAPRFVDDREV